MLLPRWASLSHNTSVKLPLGYPISGTNPPQYRRSPIGAPAAAHPPIAAPPERSPPEIGHIMPERREHPAIARDRVVGEVASYDLPQPFPLLRDRLMHSTS